MLRRSVQHLPAAIWGGGGTQGGCYLWRKLAIQREGVRVCVYFVSISLSLFFGCVKDF